MKKVWKYLIITILMLLGLCCVGVLYLFFIPNSSLFNITYLHKSETVSAAPAEQSTVSRIVLNSRAYKVNIWSTKDQTVQLEVVSKTFGFVSTDNKHVKVSSNIKNNTLTFDIQEAYGFAILNGSHINLYIPQDKIYDLSLTNKSAQTNLLSTKIQINNFTYKTNSGDLNLEQGKISGGISLDLNRAVGSISNVFETNKNNISLKLTTGKFYAKNSTLGDVTISKNERGVISIKECNRLSSNIATAGGSINISKLAHINVKTSDTDIKITEVTDGAIVYLTKMGSVNIGTLKGVSDISTNSGSINLNVIESPLTLKTNSGNINVKAAKMTIDITSEYGDVVINFHKDAQSYLDNNNSRVLIANIYNSKLTANGVEHIGLASADEGIKVRGNGRVYLNMKNVYGNNSIEGKNGNVKTVINKDSEYILTTQSNSGNVKVNLMQIASFGGYKTKTLTTTNVNCTSSANSLTVTTNNGDLTILDTKFA